MVGAQRKGHGTSKGVKGKDLIDVDMENVNNELQGGKREIHPNQKENLNVVDLTMDLEDGDEEDGEKGRMIMVMTACKSYIKLQNNHSKTRQT